MAHCVVSRTVSFLIIATFFHLVVITSLADQEHEKLERARRSYENHRNKHRQNNLASGNEIFTTENSTVVTAQVGGTATLPCGVRKFNNGVVSWIRRRDFQLLTVGLTTYSSDDRFLVEHARHLQNWALQIKFVTPNDAGMYECQISIHPPSSIFIEMKVVDAAAEIIGAPDLHIKSGSMLRIVCSFKQNTEAPAFVFWYHDERMINYDKDRVSVSNDKFVSVLHIREADKTDSGNYSCVPSNAKPTFVIVHVLNGEKPAAMQHGHRNNAPSSLSDPFLFVLCSLVIFALAQTGCHSQRLWLQETIELKQRRVYYQLLDNNSR